jgi:hypothetical protein
MWVVYKIKRSDGLQYIGKTNTNRLKKRMYDHGRSERFKNYAFNYEILFETEDHDLVKLKEKYFIEIYDTYHSGLNRSIDGSGNHNAPNFTTLGIKFSEETKEKIRKKAIGNQRTKGLRHSEETKKRWSELRKGKVWSKKIDESIVRDLMVEFKNTPIQETTISKNGKPLSHLRNFCNKNAEKYKMSSANIKKILSGKTLVWEQIYKEILDTKS